MVAAVTGLLHVAIKTNDLDRTVRFYTDILGLAPVARPDFGFPGAWLAVPTPVGEAVIHLYAGGPALGRDGRAPLGTAAIDHLSITAIGFHDFVKRIRERSLPWREFIVPGTTYWQLFVFDPNGVQLELTFDGRAETGPLPDMSEGRRYIAGESFFDAGAYERLCAVP